MSEDGQPVKVWRKCHPVLPLALVLLQLPLTSSCLPFPGLVAQDGLTRILLPLGRRFMSRSLGSPLDTAGVRSPGAPAPRPGGRSSLRPAGGSIRPGWGRASAAGARRAVTNFLPVAFPPLLRCRGGVRSPRQRRRRGRSAPARALVNKPCGSLCPLCWSCGHPAPLAPRGGRMCPHSTPCEGDRHAPQASHPPAARSGPALRSPTLGLTAPARSSKDASEGCRRSGLPAAGR